MRWRVDDHGRLVLTVTEKEQRRLQAAQRRGEKGGCETPFDSDGFITYFSHSRRQNFGEDDTGPVQPVPPQGRITQPGRCLRPRDVVSWPARGER
jgi:hypothetical protein